MYVSFERGGGPVLATRDRAPGVVPLAARRRVVPMRVWGRVDVVRDEEPEVLPGSLGDSSGAVNLDAV